MTRVMPDPAVLDDADTPSAAVGSLPPVDLARVGGPLALVFVGGAAFVLAQRMWWIGPGGPVSLTPDLVLSALRAVATVLLPAALLVRVPNAARTHRLLLAGLALGAAAEVLRSAAAIWVPQGGLAWIALDVIWQGLVALGALLVGLGLLRLRSGRPGRIGLLAAMAVAYVALTYVPVWIWAVATPSDYSFGYGVVLYIVELVAAAFATWVAVEAWLARDAPRRFWGLLALALPLTLLAGAVDAAVTIAAMGTAPSDFTSPAATFLLAVRASVAVLALLAYGLLTPVEAVAKEAPSRS